MLFVNWFVILCFTAFRLKQTVKTPNLSLNLNTSHFNPLYVLYIDLMVIQINHKILIYKTVKFYILVFHPRNSQIAGLALYCLIIQ